MTKISQYSVAAFDLDGTLLDTRDELVEACKKTALARGWEFTAQMQHKARSHCGHGGAAMFTALWPDIKPQLLSEVLGEFVDLYDASIGSNTPWIHGAEEFVDQCRTRGMRTAILTNKNKYLTRRLLGRKGIGNAFDYVVARDSLRVCKPAPDGLHILANVFAVAPESMIWFGDSITDANTGIAAGVETILVRTGFTPMAEIDSLALRQYEDFHQIREYLF